jgi:hypothetical protein
VLFEKKPPVSNKVRSQSATKKNLLSTNVTYKIKILFIIVTVGIEELLSENKFLDVCVKEVCRL